MFKQEPLRLNLLLSAAACRLIVFSIFVGGPIWFSDYGGMEMHRQQYNSKIVGDHRSGSYRVRFGFRILLSFEMKKLSHKFLLCIFVSVTSFACVIILSRRMLIFVFSFLGLFLCECICFFVCFVLFFRLAVSL